MCVFFKSWRKLIFILAGYKFDDNRRVGNVVEWNVCHCKLNKAVITQNGEEKHDSLFVCFSPLRRLLTSRFRNNFFAKPALMRSIVLLFTSFFWTASKIEAESELKITMSFFCIFQAKCVSVVTKDKFITLRISCC